MARGTNQLQPYVPRLVRDWDKDDSDAVWREVDGSMIFVDVSGFTAMSERLARQGKVGAEEVTEVIGSTFATLLEDAYAYQGSLLKFGGDALLLFFQGDGHHSRAAAAAHGMRARLRQIGTFTTTAGNVHLRMSVGVHTGTFLFFLVGRSHRELVVTGAAVSELVSMEGAASAGQILLSPAMAAALPAANRGRDVGPGFLLAGQVEAKRSVYELIPYHRDLSLFIPRGLREYLAGGGLEPEHRPVTVAFVHYSGVDEMVRKSGPETAARAIESLVGDIQDVIDARGVTFLGSDIAGDGGKIILAAGVPSVSGNDEELMLLSLREILATDRDLAVSVGVNRGHVFAGEVGPGYRRTYTVMGDAVNLAARLMAQASPGQILTTGDVLADSRTIFDTTELEPFTVKGKKEPVTAFEVGEPKGSRRSTTGPGISLIGRESEMKILTSARDSSLEGRGRLVEISAEPGMGKSRLIEEFIGTIGEGRALVSECRLYQATTPYFPFHSLMRQALGLEEPDEKKAIAGLQRLVADTAPHLLRWLPLIAATLSLKVPDTEEVSLLSDSARRSKLEESVWDLLARVLDSPTTIVFEDAHWMDDASRDLLEAGRILVGGLPWLMVVTRRPDEDGFVAPEGESVYKLALGPLDTEHALTLINEATLDRPLRPQEVRELAERAQGNPLFLFELLNALRRGEEVDGLPDTVEGLIRARIDSLPVADRNLLRRLSVLGIGFRVEHMGSVVPITTQQSAFLRRLADFVASPRTGWVQFHHALIRDAAYQGMPYRTRQRLHARVAESISEFAGDTPESQAALLSLHYYYAGSWTEARTYSIIAGDSARALYANLEAARFYERAVTAGKRIGGDQPGMVDLWRSLAAVREQGGLFEESFEALREATRLTTDPIEVARLYRERAKTRLRVGRYGSALRESAIGLQVIEGKQGDEATKARSSLLSLRALTRLQQGHAHEALELALEAASAAEAAEDKDLLAQAYAVIDNAYDLLGHPELAVYELKALRIYEELGDLLGIATAANNLGVKAYSEGDWLEAVSRYTQALDAYHRVGNESQAALVGANLGETLISLRRFPEAEEVLTDARRVLRAHDLVPYAIFAETQLARLVLEQGRPAEAVEDLQELIEEAKEVGFVELVVDAAIQLASAYTSAGSPEVALEIVSQAVQDAGDEAVYFEVTLGRVRAEALAAAERWDEARTEVEAALSTAEQQGLAHERAGLLLIRSRLPGADAAKDVEEADRLLHSLGLVVEPFST